MRTYADCSFLIALLRRQDNTDRALAHYEHLREPLDLSWLLVFEFEQSVRLQMFRHRHDRRTGIPEGEGIGMLVKFDDALAGSAVRIVPVDLRTLVERARELSERHTLGAGHRALDILHVATALVLGATEFRTFDANQRKLARAEGLAVPL